MVWWAAAPGTLLEQVALSAVIIGGITTVLVNLNPLIPLDGYYALSDWLEVPNLRQRAFGHLRWLLQTRVFRLEVPEPPADERERRIFVIYGLLAAFYIGSIFLFLGGAAYGWLSEALGALGVLLFAATVWLMARDSLLTWGRTAAASARQLSARVPRGRWARVAAAAAAVVLVGALVPWSITVTGPFTVAPVSRLALVAADSGVVFEVTAKEGIVAPAGMTLARVRNLDLERAATGSERVADSLALREAMARAAGRNGEAARLAAEARSEAARLAGLRERIGSLVLRAPGPSLVVSRHPEELVGRWVALGDTLVEVAGAGQVEARIAVEGAGAPLIRPGLPVRLISHADPARTAATTVTAVAVAASEPAGAVETRAGIAGGGALQAGMTGEASITLRRSNAWGALWWVLRRRVRTDILL
jgi:putative peptide zinc metalloprotease protein